MPNHIAFTTEARGITLVEVEEVEISPRGGESKAGLLDKLKNNLSRPGAKLDIALQNAVKQNVRPTLQSACDLAEETEVVRWSPPSGWW